MRSGKDRKAASPAMSDTDASRPVNEGGGGEADTVRLLAEPEPVQPGQVPGPCQFVAFGDHHTVGAFESAQSVAGGACVGCPGQEPPDEVLGGEAFTEEHGLTSPGGQDTNLLRSPGTEQTQFVPCARPVLAG